MKYKIQWEVNDGYCGGARPQYTKFDSEDWMDDDEWKSMTEEQKEDAMEEAVQNDFEQLGFSIINKKEIK
jgi:hypothetical protein